jgi:hypothetical protein
MGITAFDLGAWVSIYFGMGLIRARFPCSRANSADYDLRRKLEVSGCSLLVIGTSVLGIGMLR